MVGLLQLIFNDDGPTASIFGEYIDPEASSGLLTSYIRQLDPNDLRQHIRIVNESSRKIERFMRPNFLQLDPFKAPNHAVSCLLRSATQP